VLLVAVGPERLPGLARQAGKLLVRGRNWLQSSPDAALILRARQEIEQELASIRSSLLEVQSVRDEVLGAARQLEDSVSSLASANASLDDVGTIAPPAAQATPAAGGAVPPADPETAALGEPATSTLAAPSTGVETGQAAPTEPQPAPEIKLDQWSVARQPAPQAAAPRANGASEASHAQDRSAAALESIELRLQAIMADLHALQAQLKQRGALDADWAPPSWGMSMDDTTRDERAPQPDAEEPIATEEAA
jgi:sec-independent protein translocase protein TatB